MKTLTVKEIARMIRADVVGDESIEISGVAALSDAVKFEVTFLGNNKYKDQVQQTKASAVILPSDYQGEVPADKAWLLCNRPSLAFSKVIDHFAPETIKYEPGIHPSATVADSAKIDPSCFIGPGAVIEPGVVIGKSTVICAGAYVGHNAKIGSKCKLYPNAVIRERCELGNKVVIHCNTVIGDDGFGYAPSGLGITKIPQVGIVKIEDDVEIGALCTVDRARFGKTWIKQGVKMDDHVHVAHNVKVGEYSMLIGQSGVAGSAEIGRGVIIAAQAGINGHITIGDGARIAGTSGVARSVEPGATVIGTPAVTKKEFGKKMVLHKTVDKLKNRIINLETTINELKAGLEAILEPNDVK